MDSSTKNIVGIVFVLVIAISFIGTFPVKDDTNENMPEMSNKFTQFDSSEQFKSYVSQRNPSSELVRAFSVMGVRTTSAMSGSQDIARVGVTSEISASDQISADGMSGDGSVSKTASRINTRQTNIQEKSVGEPDIVKVTQDSTYYIPENKNRHTVTRTRINTPDSIQIDPPTRNAQYVPPQPKPPTTKQISNPNTGNTSVTGELRRANQLLRSDSSLVAYNNSVITGHNLKNDGKTINQQWDVEINSSYSVTTTRRIGSTAYFVARSEADSCSTHPINNQGQMKCSDVFHPTNGSVGSDSVYTVFALDMDTGDVIDELAFVGGGSTTVYMSKNNLYISYEVVNFKANDAIDIALNTDGIPEDSQTTQSLRNLKDADMSSRVKMNELEELLAAGRTGNAEFKENFTQKMRQYVSDNRRKLFRSTVVSIDISNGEITPSHVGQFPGVPLNQFAFDEKDGELRVATTVSPDNPRSSQNDVYVLNDKLEIQGSVQGMAEGQQIYAVRFIGDMGYVITYRQVDPLHVIDLSNSENPEEVGVLKLPGFSQYLHKVGDGKLLGVGESANSKGKAVLFNISDPNNPTVADSYIMNEHSTAVSESHRAFMNDPTVDNAYIPAGNSLYVLNYSSDELHQQAKIQLASTAKRTRLYNEDLLAFSNDQIVVVDKSDYDMTKAVGMS